MAMRGLSRARRMIGQWVPILLLSCLGAAGCSQVPLTERSQLDLVPDAQLNAMAANSYQELISQSDVSANPAASDTVRRVGRNIQQAAQWLMAENQRGDELKGYEWEYTLIEANTVNAFAMPGGKVGFFSGILPLTRDDAGLAVVMGHEIAHVLANHGGERMSQVLVAQLGGMALSEALRKRPEETRELFFALYGLGAQVGFLLPYSRLQEREADRIGLILMARAGYDPRQAIPFWERMAAQGGPQPPVFLSGHPATKTRIESLKELMPEALKYYEENKQ